MLCLQVTPSSKVVGDLAQFMVQNSLTEHTVVERAGSLNFPDRHYSSSAHVTIRKHMSHDMAMMAAVVIEVEKHLSGFIKGAYIMGAYILSCGA